MKDFFRHFITYSFLFDINRGSIDRSDKVLFGIGVGAFVISIVLSIIAGLTKQALKKEFFWRLAKPIMFIGITELIWFGARYEYVSFLGSHAVALVLLLIGVVWLGMSIKWRVKVYPGLMDAWKKHREKDKYLIKRK